MTFPNQTSSPGRNNNNNRNGRRGRQRGRRNQRRQQQQNYNNTPRSDSESEMSSSDSSTTTAVGIVKDNRRHHHSPKKTPTIVMDESLFVAMDCEMVGVGEYGKQSALARVTMIDWNGNIIMDELVKPKWEVTDYRTFVSGITPEMLWAARMDFDTCRQHVLTLLEGKILVGHGLKNDLRVLGITHPWHMIRDTAKYQPFMKVRFQDGILWPRGLKDLCQEKLNREVQVYGCPHCPKEDAMAAMDLYKLVQHKWEKAMEYKINKTRAIEQERQQFLELAAAKE